MAKSKAVEMSVDDYAKLETPTKKPVTRGSVYRWIYDKEAGRPSKLPRNVSIKKVIDRYVLVVKEEKKKAIKA